jgi:hypothetical protein
MLATVRDFRVQANSLRTQGITLTGLKKPRQRNVAEGRFAFQIMQITVSKEDILLTVRLAE